MARPRGADEGWRARPGLSHALRAAVFAVPIAAAFLAAMVVGWNLPEPAGALRTALTVAVLLASSTLALAVTDRLMRRLLPLAWLLKLTLLFPDHVPSRFAIARQALGSRRYRAQLDEVRKNGLGEDASRAAETILGLIAALARHDPRTRGHSERVRVLTELIAEELALSEADRALLRWAALLHDVGKLIVPADVLNKPRALDEHEWAVIRAHPEQGRRLVAPMVSWLGEWATAIDQHHERIDGSGYPRGLLGPDISFGAKIVAVADCYETMTAARSYRRPISAAAAREELAANAGTQFDPLIVRAFLNLSLGRLRRAGGVVGLGWLPLLPERLVHAFGSLGPAGAAVGGALAIGLAVVPAALVPRGVTPAVLSEQRSRPAFSVDVPPLLGAPTIPDAASSAAPTSPPGDVPTGSEQPTPGGGPKPKPSPSPSPVPSPVSEYRNHGDCVADVARLVSAGPGHGQAVSAAASREVTCV